MTTTIATDTAKAKLLFTGLYLITVGILFVIFMALWKDNPGQHTTKAVEDRPMGKNEERISQAAALLHSHMQAVEEAWISGAKGDNQKFVTVENKFTVVLDSVEKSAGSLKDEQEQLALKKLTTDFRTSFQTTKALVIKYGTSKDTVYANAGNSEVVDNLKVMLVDKEQKLAALQIQMQQQASDKDGTIASLQNQLQNSTGKDKSFTALQTQMQTSLAEKDKRITGLQNSMQTSITERDKKITTLQTGLADKDKTITALQNQLRTLAATKQNNTAVPKTNSNDGAAEWRQKHAQLKTAYDNLASKNSALIKSYETLAQDNKRLTSELQIRRATGKG